MCFVFTVMCCISSAMYLIKLPLFVKLCYVDLLVAYFQGEPGMSEEEQKKLAQQYEEYQKKLEQQREE